MRTLLSFVAAFAFVSTTTGSAMAQSWLADRKATEGRGVKLGNFELHPGLGAEVGYDSNWLMRSSDSGANVLNGPPNQPVRGAGLLRITPSLSLRTLGAQRTQGQGTPPPVVLEATLSATYREFLGEKVIRDQRNIAIGSDFRVGFAPGRPASFDLLAGYNRLIRANTLGDPAMAFNVSSPYAGAVASFRPGGGSFEYGIGYRLTAMLFEQANARPLSNLRHDVTVNNRWQFRPRTSFFHLTSLGVVQYLDPGQSALLLLNSTPLRSRLGVNGLLGNRFAVTAAAGYGASFIAESVATRQFDSLIGNAELRFYVSGNPVADEADRVPAAQSIVSAGFERDFQQAFIGNVATVHRGYLGTEAYLAGRILLRGRAALASHTFQPVFLLRDGNQVSQVTGTFTALRPELEAYGEYRFSNSFAVTLTGRYTQSIADQRIPYDNISPPGVFSLAWRRFEALGGVRWFL